ncbi:hypothetical protein, partial [Streptomyces kanasensis]|uniref:hypothetical protein n=1 Tax=Streptomyces kanasensis TaxID=936756 RepID=UPI001E52E441
GGQRNSKKGGAPLALKQIARPQRSKTNAFSIKILRTKGAKEKHEKPRSKNEKNVSSNPARLSTRKDRHHR